jgi:hypothetical protein
MEEQETRPGVRSLIEATFRGGRDDKENYFYFLDLRYNF